MTCTHLMKVYLGLYLSLVALPFALSFCKQGATYKTDVPVDLEFKVVEIIHVAESNAFCISKVQIVGADPIYIGKWIGPANAEQGAQEVSIYDALQQCEDPTSLKLVKLPLEDPVDTLFPLGVREEDNELVMGQAFLMDWSKQTIDLDTVIQALTSEDAQAKQKITKFLGKPYSPSIFKLAAGLNENAEVKAIIAEYIAAYFAINFDLVKCGVDHDDMETRNVLVTTTPSDHSNCLLSFDYDISKQAEFDEERRIETFRKNVDRSLEKLIKVYAENAKTRANAVVACFKENSEGGNKYLVSEEFRSYLTSSQLKFQETEEASFLDACHLTKKKVEQEIHSNEILVANKN